MCLTCAEPGENCQKRFQYKSGYKSPFFREKLLWRQSIPMSISHPRNARPRVLTGREEEGWGGGGGGGGRHTPSTCFTCLSTNCNPSLLCLDLICSITLQMILQTWTWCHHQRWVQNSNCIVRLLQSVIKLSLNRIGAFWSISNQFWASVHSKPSEIWRWCHRFYDAIVPVSKISRVLCPCLQWSVYSCTPT